MIKKFTILQICLILLFPTTIASQPDKVGEVKTELRSFKERISITIEEERKIVTEYEITIKHQKKELTKLKGELTKKNSEITSLIGKLHTSEREQKLSDFRIKELEDTKYFLEQEVITIQSEMRVLRNSLEKLELNYQMSLEKIGILKQKNDLLQQKVDEQSVWRNQGFGTLYTLSENIIIKKFEAEPVKEKRNGNLVSTNKKRKWKGVKVAIDIKPIGFYQIPADIELYVKVRNIETGQFIYRAEGTGRIHNKLTRVNGIWVGTFPVYGSKQQYADYSKFAVTVYARTKFTYPNRSIGGEASFPLINKVFRLK